MAKKTYTVKATWTECTGDTTTYCMKFDNKKEAKEYAPCLERRTRLGGRTNVKVEIL